MLPCAREGQNCPFLHTVIISPRTPRIWQMRGVRGPEDTVRGPRRGQDFSQLLPSSPRQEGLAGG